MGAEYRSRTAGQENLDARLRDLLRRQPEGCALLQEFYLDPEIFERDLERLHLGHWLCVGHLSRIPRSGDYFVFDIASESLIIVRGKDDEVRALVNVCRHRGSHVCYDKEGHSNKLACPYHGWTYNLDGSLFSARLADEAMDKSQYGLAQVQLRTIEGLIFVCFADDPPSLEAAEAALAPALKHYGWATAKVAHRDTYSVDANWKLATENYLECYHCAPAHPEFSQIHATDEPIERNEGRRQEALRRAQSFGIELPRCSRQFGEAGEGEGFDVFHDATHPGAVTGSEDGQAVAPLMGDFEDYNEGFTYLDLGPASFFLAYPDYGVLFLFVPRSCQKTDMEIVWLVDGNAEEGRDYELSRLIWMWDVTTRADKIIIDHNQKGVSSRYYRPGPYTPMESYTQSFASWYLEQIAPS